MITDDNVYLSKKIMDKMICPVSNFTKAPKFYYNKGVDKEFYRFGYFCMTILSYYEQVRDRYGYEVPSYYKFKVSVDGCTDSIELTCILNNEDRSEFDIGKKIYGLCYYNTKYNTLNAIVGIRFNDYINSFYQQKTADLIKNISNQVFNKENIMLNNYSNYVKVYDNFYKSEYLGDSNEL